MRGRIKSEAAFIGRKGRRKAAEEQMKLGGKERECKCKAYTGRDLLKADINHRKTTTHIRTKAQRAWRSCLISSPLASDPAAPR